MSDAGGCEGSARTAADPPNVTELLTSRGFLTALALLILNDWFLKAALANGLTGKLSDFAGVAAFAIFGMALLPRRRRAVCVLTGIAFMLWKSPLSDGSIAWWNSVSPLRIGRVVDFTDWLAVLVLIPILRGVERPAPPGVSRRRTSWPRRLAALGAGCVAVIAFSATSIATPPPEFVDPISWPVPSSLAEVQEAIATIGVVSAVESRPPYEKPSGDRVTLTLHIRQPPERPVDVTARLRTIDESNTEMTLLGARSSDPRPLNREAVERAFELQVYEPLIRQLTSPVGQ
jgi:hypothetical protein